MHTTLTPSCLHDVTFCSLKKPRSDPYNSGAWPKACLCRSSEGTTCCSSTGLPSSTSYWVIRPCALSARNTLWPNSMGVCTLDQVGMGLEDRIDLLGVGNLLAAEHTAASLIDHPASQAAKVLDLLARLRDDEVGKHVLAARLAGVLEGRSRAFHDLRGNADEFAVCPGLLPLALPRRHPLDFVHPTPCRTRPISEPLDTPALQCCGEASDQARDNANHIPQQRVVGWMMNVRLHHRGVNPQLLPILQPTIDRRLHHQLIDCLERLGRQSIEAAVERIVSRDRLTMEVRELAQRIPIRNPLAQFALVPVLDAHEHQRAQNLLRRQTAATRLGSLQTPRQIASDLLDDVLLVVEKIRDGLQQRLKTKTLTHQLPISKTDLSPCDPRHRSALAALRRRAALPLQCLDISRRGLVQQILQSMPVVQTALHLGHKLFRHVNGNATPLRATVQHITLMLLARLTSRAVVTDAPRSTQAQRAKNCRPKPHRFTLQPANDIGGRFRIIMFHVKHVTICTCACQSKLIVKNRKKPPIFSPIMPFATETSLVGPISRAHRCPARRKGGGDGCCRPAGSVSSVQSAVQAIRPNRST